MPFRDRVTGASSDSVGANTCIILTEMPPFSAVEQSGHGPEGPRHGIDDDLEIKYIRVSS